jgi:hypothetical protein
LLICSRGEGVLNNTGPGSRESKTEFRFCDIFQELSGEFGEQQTEINIDRRCVYQHIKVLKKGISRRIKKSGWRKLFCEELNFYLWTRLSALLRFIIKSENMIFELKKNFKN